MYKLARRLSYSPACTLSYLDKTAIDERNKLKGILGELVGRVLYVMVCMMVLGEQV
jgi:hypothetical protein